MKLKQYIIYILVLCLALPPALLGSFATTANAASLTAAPIANPQTVASVSGYYTPIELTGYDADGDPLTFLIVTNPSHGTLYDSPPFVTYRSVEGYTGTDYFEFVVQDGIGESNVARVTINIRSNTDPVAYSQTVASVSGYYTPIELTGYDADGDPLTFLIVTNPSHGTLYDSPPFVTYRSLEGYTGTDYFEFVVDDGSSQSAPAQVTINIRSNTDPVAYPQTVASVSGYYTPIELTGYDADGDPLTFLIVTNPSHGTLYDSPPFVTYRSLEGYTGTDYFEFVVQDGIGESNVARVTINIRSNTDPVAYPQTVASVSGYYTPIELTGYDADGDPLTFLIVTNPSHGTLYDSPPFVTYRSAGGYTGTDYFEFVVQDGIGESNVARVTINIRSNTDPVAYPQTVASVSGYYTPIELTGYDADGDPLTFLIVTNPSHGTLYDSPPFVTYRSVEGYTGTDYFEFVVQDGIGESNVARVTINIRSNTDPVAYPQTVEAFSAIPLPITLTGSDADGDPLTFLVVTDPVHGELMGTGANVIYTSEPGYVGPDYFEFVVQDGIGESNVARVDITVIQANHAPVAEPQSLNATSSVPLPLVLTGTDPDGDALTFQVTDQPDHGTLTGTAPNLTYTSTLGYIGADSFQFVVSDGTLISDPATVNISVSSSGPVTVFFDNFETNLGWVRNPNGTDTAHTGMWERADPEYTWWSGPKQLGSTVSGSYDLVTGARAGWEPGSYDIDYGVTSIKSPSIALPANSSLTLTFSYYLAHANNSSSADFLRVKIVGSTTTTVLQVLGTNKDKDAIWSTATINLSAFAGKTVYILIEAADNSSASLVEAAVDDVKIVANPMSILGGNTTNSK